MPFNQLYPKLTGGSQWTLGCNGDHFLEVLRSTIATFIEPYQGARIVDLLAGITLGAFLGE
jgi:hypothetical protein